MQSAKERIEVKFSIGIPAYKNKFLEEAIESVLAQTYCNYELIIVNDASPNNIDEVVKQFTDNRIKYYVNENNVGAEHVVGNWNQCLERATGEYFVLMGDDDKLLPDYLAEFLKLIIQYPNLDVFHCRTIIIDEESKPLRLTPACPEYETVYDHIWHRMNNYRIQFISDFMYRTSVLKINGGYFYLPLAWSTDDVSAYIACGTKGIAYVQKPIFCYRENSLSISSSGNNELKMQANIGLEGWMHSFLMFQPDNEIDKLLWNNICTLLSKYIKKKKIYTIAKGLSPNILLNLYRWIKVRKKYSFSSFDILLGVAEFLKEKIVYFDITREK